MLLITAPLDALGSWPPMLDQARGLEGPDEAGEGAHIPPPGCKHREFGRCLCTQPAPGSWRRPPGGPLSRPEGWKVPNVLPAGLRAEMTHPARFYYRLI